MGTTSSIQPVILAGGSGSRLWPASRQDRPKQLLALTGERSLLQETALRLSGFSAASVAPEPLLVTNREYRLTVAKQLAEVGFEHPRLVLEPCGRNTAPALTLACLALAEEAGDPILFVMASDHVIADIAAFHEAAAQGAEQADAGQIVLFGIVPDQPETGYGYIRVGEAVPGTLTARTLVRFEEKPDVATAEAYLAAGDYLWNSGMFMMRLSVWLAAVERYRPDIYGACRAAVRGQSAGSDLVRVDEEAFRICPTASIDCAVLERLTGPAADTRPFDSSGDPSPVRAVVIPLDCGWSDVGGWAALSGISASDEAGNVVKGDVVLTDTRDTLVYADSRLVAVLGVDGLVIVDTPDALLVADRAKTRDLKALVARVQERDERLTACHRRQYRPWGRFECMDAGERFQVKRIVVDPGAMLSLQLHHQRAEHWVVVSGVADVTCGDKSFRLQEDQSTYIPVNTPHRLANPGPEPLEIIEVQSGDYLGEDDIVRLEDSYGRLGDS